jgi:hypothetical protein
MDMLKLRVQKRAFPSHGRARVHGSVLETLGVTEQERVDVGVPEQNRWVSASAYSDSMVKPDLIRLSAEDMAKIGVNEGDIVTVRKTPPITEQVKKMAKDTAGQVSGGLDDLSGKFSSTVAPATKRAGDAAKDAYAKVSQELPTREDIRVAFETAKKKITPTVSPDDVGALLSLVYGNKGAIRAVTIPSTVRALTIAGLDLPDGVTAIAIRRGKNILVIPHVNTELTPGDRVFLIGDESMLLSVAKEIEG